MRFFYDFTNTIKNKVKYFGFFCKKVILKDNFSLLFITNAIFTVDK
jgi:hypothetical protein